MHVKITTSGSRRYVQFVESYRDDAGKVKKRTVATLGRLDFESARALGDVWALTELWKELGFDTLNLFPGELVDVYIGKK